MDGEQQQQPAPAAVERDDLDEEEEEEHLGDGRRGAGPAGPSGRGLDGHMAEALKRTRAGQKSQARRVVTVGALGYRGVRMQGRRFMAAFKCRPMFGARSITLGTFDSAEEAAEAYDRAAIFAWTLEGARAGLNFPDRYTAQQAAQWQECTSLVQVVPSARLPEADGQPRKDGGLRGIRAKKSGRFRACVGGIRAPGNRASRRLLVDDFQSQEAAARAHDRALLRLRALGLKTGGRLNFPEEQ